MPTPEHGLLAGHGEISAEQLASLEKGKTTREEILLLLGEPSGSLDEGRILVYHWEVLRGYLIWAVPACCQGGAGGAGGVAGIPKDYLLLMEFDDCGRLERYSQLSTHALESISKRIDEWTPPETVKLSDLEKRAGEVAREPRMYETIGRFVVEPDLVPDTSTGTPLAGISPRRVKLERPRSARAAGNSRLIGKRTAAFGAVTHYIYLTQRRPDLVRSALAAQWVAAGHSIVDVDPEVTVAGRVEEFRIETPLSVSGWNAIGVLDVTIEVRAKGRSDSITRHYQLRRVEKTIRGPSEQDIRKLIEACLQALMHDLATDLALARYLDNPGQLDGLPSETLAPPVAGRDRAD